MPREIEVRFKLTSEQKGIFLDWIEKNAKFDGETHHIEHYLDNAKNTFIFENKNGYKDSEKYLRVRFDEKKSDSVCLKVFKIDQENETSENLNEIEYSVSSGEAALQLFTALGYSAPAVVDKTRKKYFSADGEFEICIDEVKGLGTFAEVELRGQIEGDISVGFKRIYAFLKMIGITSIDEQHRGYVSMLWNPDINFGKENAL